MVRIVVNKHFPDYQRITSEVFDKFQGKGEIVISNEVEKEALYILNEAGNVIKFSPTNPEEFTELIMNYLKENYWTSGETSSAIVSNINELSANTVTAIGSARALTYEVSGSVITLYENVDALSGTVKTLIENPPIDEETVRRLAQEEASNEVSKGIALVINNAPDSFDTLKEVADWIQNDETNAAQMVTDIETLKTDVNVLTKDVAKVSEDVNKVTEDISATVQFYVNEAIANINASEHIPLTRVQYDTLIENGRVTIIDKGEYRTIIYNDNNYYMIYEDELEDETPEIIVEPDFTQGEVVLLANYKPAKPVEIKDIDVLVNLNGNKVIAPTFTESNGAVLAGNSDSYGFWVKSGSLTIEGDGEVVAQNATYSMAVWANGGNVTIKGGTYRNGGDSCDLIYASAGGNIVIEGGEFFSSGPASGTAPETKNPYSTLNVKDADYKSGISSIIVKGGKFHNFNPANNLSEGENTNFVAEGYKSVEVEPNVWEVMPNVE